MRLCILAGWLLLVTFAGLAFAQSKNLAPGFASLPKGAKLAIMPMEIELFSISGGGVIEPRADWTEAASGHFKAALMQKKLELGFEALEVAEKDADELAEITALHAAVARSIWLHHFGSLTLPTKGGELDWSLGESARAIKRATGADYALFTMVRDSYASEARVAAMILLAPLGILLDGGVQRSDASLVDLDTGRVLWFNRLQRRSGDLRDAERAAETLEALLDQFPVAK
jgi:hypothetical protein